MRSAGKTNFWTYAPQYGFNVAPNVGITGNGLSGNMALAEAIAPSYCPWAA